MVVMLIGIMAVIRIFPTGFLAIKNQGDYTRAARISSAEMERLKEHSANLPDAIYAVKYDYNASGDLIILSDPDTSPDDLKPGLVPVGSGVDPRYISDVNRIRRVVGERVLIPAPQVMSDGKSGGLYLINFSPFVPGNEGQLIVYGNPLFAHEMDSSTEGSVSYWSFGVDYNDGGTDAAILLPPPPSNLSIANYPDGKIPYRVSFAYWYLNGGNWEQRYVVSTQVEVGQADPDPTKNWISFKDNLVPTADQSNYKGIVEGTVKVAYAFKVLNQDSGDPNFTANWPYEVKVDKNNPWRVIFNPSGFGYKVPSGWHNMTSLVANIDYDVLDWHILHEDRRVPDDKVNRVELSLGDIKHIGELDNDNLKYLGLAPGLDSITNAFTNKDVIVLDTANGDIVDPACYEMDYKSGTVQFKEVGNFKPGGRTLRILYSTMNNWAMQVQKADAHYSIRPALPLQVGQCYIGGSNANTGNATRIYFPRCDVGKQVTVRDYYYKANGATNRGSNDTFLIQGFETIGGIVCSYIDIKDAYADATSFDWVTGFAVRGVEGISIKVRVIWKPATKSWNKYDADGVLSRTEDVQ